MRAPGLPCTYVIRRPRAEKWSLASSVFYVGFREDTTNLESVFIPVAITPNRTLDAFIDANVQLDYDITNQFLAFVKVNNIANTSYNRWNNYPVQGIQILGGASYKFDF